MSLNCRDERGSLLSGVAFAMKERHIIREGVAGQTLGATGIAAVRWRPSAAEQGWLGAMPGGGLFIGMADTAEDILGKVAGDQLQTHRHALAVKTTRQ